MTTTVDLPGALVEWIPGTVLVRRRGTPDPGTESILIEWREAADGDLLASTTTPKSWKVTHRIDGVRVRSTADVDLGGDDPARAAYYANRVELWVWWRGELIHRGPLRQRSWGIPDGGQSADDGAVWVDGITMLDDDAANPYADELDQGRIMSMAQAYARRTVPFVGGGELSSEVPLLREVWADKPAGPIVDEIALARGVEWMVVPDPEDGAYRVRWSNEWGRHIGSDEFTARCMPGGAEERNTVTVAAGQETGTDVAGRVFARSAGGKLGIHETNLWGSDLFLERFVQAPTGMEDIAELEYLAGQEMVPGDMSATLDLADKGSARVVRIGDYVVCRVSTPDIEVDGPRRVLTWEVGNDGASITVGIKPKLAASTVYQRWQDRMRELEERRDRPDLGSLDDVRIEDATDPAVVADPIRHKDVLHRGSRLVNKSRTLGGGREISYWAPGAALDAPIATDAPQFDPWDGSLYNGVPSTVMTASPPVDDRPWRASVYVACPINWGTSEVTYSDVGELSALWRVLVSQVIDVGARPMMNALGPLDLWGTGEAWGEAGQDLTVVFQAVSGGSIIASLDSPLVVMQVAWTLL